MCFMLFIIAYGVFFLIFMTWFVQDNNYKSPLCQKLFWFSHDNNEWQGNVTCVQAHIHTSGKQDIVKGHWSNSSSWGLKANVWQKMLLFTKQFQMRIFVRTKRNSFSHCLTGKLCVIFILYNHFHMKGAYNSWGHYIIWTTAKLDQN